MDKPTKLTVLGKFDELITTVETERKQIKKMLRSEERHDIMNEEITRFFAFLLDDIKELKKDTRKVSKNTRKFPLILSGIFKKVGISEELSKFTGLNLEGKYTRVEIYSNIYSYIRNNNLNQNGEQRNIIEPDAKLKKLLGYDQNKDGQLKFYNIQEYLKRQGHFIDDKND